jgi:hypothetical protein
MASGRCRWLPGRRAHGREPARAAKGGVPSAVIADRRPPVLRRGCCLGHERHPRHATVASRRSCAWGATGPRRIRHLHGRSSPPAGLQGHRPRLGGILSRIGHGADRSSGSRLVGVSRREARTWFPGRAGYGPGGGCSPGRCAPRWTDATGELRRASARVPPTTAHVHPHSDLDP